jgi:hypothetical protein
LGLHPHHLAATDNRLKIIWYRLHHVSSFPPPPPSPPMAYLTSSLAFIRNMNHRMRGYSNPDDLIDSHSHHFHHLGEATPMNPSPPSIGVKKVTKEIENDSFLSRFYVGVCSMCGFGGEKESADDGQTRLRDFFIVGICLMLLSRLVISRRQPPAQREPSNVSEDPFSYGLFSSLSTQHHTPLLDFNQPCFHLHPTLGRLRLVEHPFHIRMRSPHSAAG